MLDEYEKLGTAEQAVSTVVELYVIEYCGDLILHLCQANNGIYNVQSPPQIVHSRACSTLVEFVFTQSSQRLRW